jgi:hypothetical protein
MSKKIFFISGFPRAGNTVLASILNQNKKIKATAHSILPDVIKNLHVLKQTPIYNNFKDEQSLNNLIEKTFTNYYNDWDCEYIIERGDWITPYNLNLLQKYFKQNEIKIVVLVRNILDIIASYLFLCKKNPEFFINTIYQSKDKSEMVYSSLEEKVDIIMGKDSYVYAMLYSVKNLLKSNFKNYIFVEYNDLVNSPKDTLNKIYSFYEIEKYDHDFNNIKQFEVNGISYDDTMHGAKMHSLKEGKMERIDELIEVPQRVIDKYSNLEFWKNETNSDR